MTTNEKPQVEIPSDEAPPVELMIDDLVLGEGDEAVPGKQVDVQYVGVVVERRAARRVVDRGSVRLRPRRGRVIKGWTPASPA
jgi:peptidylprolyl isomerase